jgi:hypothetical protein
MATKRKNLFLYLAIACFLGIIAIFIADGYIGVYDAIYVPMGEREEKVEADQWEEWSQWAMAEIGWGDKAPFRYEVDNRQFSAYSANISVSVWHSKEKVQDLISQEISIPAFDKGQLEWSIDTTELLPAGVSLEGRPVEYTIIIKRGEIERKVIFSVFGSAKISPPSG